MTDGRTEPPSAIARSDHRGSTEYNIYLVLTTAPPYMAAANFVVITTVITNGGVCALTGTADIDQ